MLFKHLRMAALSAALLAGGTGFALAQTQTSPTPDAPAATTESDGGTDYGWLGLLGLIGLAGLWRKRETHPHTRVHTETPERVHTDTTARR